MRYVHVVCCLLLSLSLLGQTKTYVGVKVGGQVNSAFLDHTIFNFQNRVTFTSGVNSGILIKHFSRKRDIFLNAGIQLGVNYSSKGWVQTFPGTTTPNYSVSMNYLEVPIEGIGYFGNKNKYFIAAGFHIERLLSVNTDDDPTDVGNSDFVTFVDGRDRKTGYGARISGGIFRDFSFGSLHLEGFFTYSFSNFIDAGDLTNDQLPDISNLWSVGASIGYLIPFGKLALTK